MTKVKVTKEVKVKEVKELPIIKSVSIQKVAKGYVSLIISTQGDKVIDVECSEPNLYPITVMNAKVAFESIL